MNYERFKEVVKEEFLVYMPKEYQHMDVVIGPVMKINRTLDGLSLRDEKTKISPTVYINDMYKRYNSGESMEAVMKGTAQIMHNSFQNIHVNVNFDYAGENIKNNIVFEIVNAEQNKELLKNTPHRKFFDLAIIYKVLLEAEDDMKSIVINSNFAKMHNLTEEQLYSLAVKNTRKLLPPKVTTMYDILKIMLEETEMAEDEDVCMLLNEMETSCTMWVITNTKNINGATSILYEDVLYELSKRINSNLFILPSSLHEVIAIRSDMMTPEEAAQMVYDVNFSQVKLEDRLSNQVYQYDRELRQLTVAVETPCKGVDGVKFICKM